MYLVLVIALIIVFSVARGLRQGISKYLLVPAEGWREKIKRNIEYPTAIYLKVGNARSSYRRRLVLASQQPSFYTNFVNNKLKIHDEDRKDNGGGFLQRMSRRSVDDPERNLLVGFFHPYANNGGGGEKVLWEAVNSTLLSNKRTIALVYTTNLDVEPLAILDKAQEKFDISTIDRKRVIFIYLRKCGNLIDNNYWRHFTLAGQILGSMFLSFEAIFELSPDIWIDTMGLPGANIFVNLFLKIPIINYVHYPIIQPDMFNKLKFNSFKIKELKKFSPGVRDIFQLGKLIYWTCLYYLYTFLGSLVDFTLVNGTWTYNHISKIWSANPPSSISILYPPCGREELNKSYIAVIERENKMLYIAQFRPEKRHKLVINQYADFVTKYKKAKGKLQDMPTLVLLGSCRTNDDTDTLTSLQEHVKSIELSSFVEFVVGCSHQEVQEWLSRATFGLNAMWNEHFGIGVVEYMKNGVIPICHASAGPLLDIVKLEKSEADMNDWKNDLGFFFKCDEDADFMPSLQEGSQRGFYTFKVPFGSNVERTIQFPSFEKLLEILFVDQPTLIDPEVLTSMQSKGFTITNKKFSNTTFSNHWSGVLHLAIEKEKEYREDKRSSAEVVY